MAPHPPKGGAGTDEPPVAPAPAAVPAPPDPIPDISPHARPLGEALKERTERVLELTSARAKKRNGVEPMVQDRFERINRNSTVAVARWICGEGSDAAIESGRETWLIYGELAAHRAVSLNQLTKRCMWWRNAVVTVLRECALELGTPPEALAQALNVLQLSLEFSLVRMSECFDTERERTDEELARREEELAFLATHDPLTGLPNRTLILDRIEQMLARCMRSQEQVVALFVDIDNFKTVNDTLGHAAGDHLLQGVAARLDGVVRTSDARGRLGGDEFVVVCEGLPLVGGPQLIAERLLEALRPPFRLGPDEQARVSVSASIGVAVGGAGTGEELLREADMAMYQAKWDGKNRYAVFEAGMRDMVEHRAELEMDLREALVKDQLFLAYQPTFALSDMTATGVEALLRWRHPVHGEIQPEDFIGLAEETGLIVEIGRWVLREACAQAAAWRRAGQEIGLAVNVSASQLDSDELVADIRDALSDSGLEPGALTIELTETTLMRNIDETARRLEEVKQLGVRIAIDDFGTGYSSLAHLQRFPVDALKIDRSFISGLSKNREGETLIHTLVQLGKALSIETFAEGIEQQEQLSHLREENCDSGQGFLFARPLDAAATEAFIKNGSTPAAPAVSG
ncbi:MAG TPA: EAL domain-containing protein [Solirubrobacteraceae bacterium]|nr:EAL domain-containing protein [Solirubrobacteraceae bacterium]